MKVWSISFAIILSSVSNLCFGQDKGKTSFVGDIRKEIEDTSSVYFYQPLVDKINKEPGKITKQEIKYLYYGQIYKKGTGLNFLDDPEENNFRKALAQSKHDKILQFGYLDLKKNPVKLTTLFPVNYSLSKKGAVDSLYIASRTKMVLEVILETGNGETRETAIKIANIEDDLVLKGLLGIKGGYENIELYDDRIFSVWTKGDKSVYFEDCWAYKVK